MLTVKTKIGPSSIAGIGLFAAEFIPKGTIVWQYIPGFDQTIPEGELEKLSEAAKTQFLNYAYHNKQTGEYVLCFDDARFFNHSADPNTHETYGENDNYGTDIASRDIREGEELTTDYHGFDQAFDYKMQHSTY